jgi:hypothetical protein
MIVLTTYLLLEVMMTLIYNLDWKIGVGSLNFLGKTVE